MDFSFSSPLFASDEYLANKIGGFSPRQLVASQETPIEKQTLLLPSGRLVAPSHIVASASMSVNKKTLYPCLRKGDGKPLIPFKLMNKRPPETEGDQPCPIVLRGSRGRGQYAPTLKFSAYLLLSCVFFRKEFSEALYNFFLSLVRLRVAGFYKLIC